MTCLPVVEVWWRDAEVHDGAWEAIDDSRAHTCPLVRSVGFLVAQTKRTTILAGCHSGEDTNARTAIPTAWIETQIELRPGGETVEDIYGTFE